MLVIVQIISLIVTTIATCGTIIGTLRSAQKERKKQVEESKKESEQRLETDRCVLRTLIKEAYYDFKPEGRWAEIDFENTEKLYNQYKALGGNSFIDRLWREMQEWEITD